jgi:hypothetical protein
MSSCIQQNKIIWGSGWYAIADDELENRWFLAPIEFFKKNGYCPDGYEYLDTLTDEQIDDLEEQCIGPDPNYPKGFYECMESCIRYSEGMDMEQQRQLLKASGFTVDDIPPWHWDRLL